MRRRDLLAFLGSAAAFSPQAVAAPDKKIPIIGFLGASTPQAMSEWVAAFVRRLHELGWSEGQNVAIEYRWAEGRTERFAEIAAEFIGLKADVIVTYGTAAVAAAKRATSVTPIVFGGAGDPVGAGLVASLARPGGNVTGMSLQQTDAAPKRLELLREAVPGLSRLAIMANADSRSAVLDMKEIQDGASSLGLHALPVEIRRPQEIAAAVEGLNRRAEALYVVTDPLLFTNRVKINTLAVAIKLPTMCSYREYVAAGCLISYGPNYPDLFRRTAEHVDRILRGANPGDIPVEQPTRFDLVMNVTTANAIGLTIPPPLLARADEIIE